MCFNFYEKAAICCIWIRWRLSSYSSWKYAVGLCSIYVASWGVTVRSSSSTKNSLLWRTGDVFVFYCVLTIFLTFSRYAMKCLDKKRIKMKHGEALALNERHMLQMVSPIIHHTRRGVEAFFFGLLRFCSRGMRVFAQISLSLMFLEVW